MTTAGLFFGFWAIVHSFNAKYDLAALGIVLAALCDAIDGRVARLARATSRFGMEYDSIADTVSFGVAPAILAFSAGHLQVLGRTGFVMTFLFTACAALRLARFNVAPSRYRGRFEGMPSPAAAGIVASTQWFVSFLREHDVAVQVPESLVAGGVAVLGLLMVSAIPVPELQGARPASLLRDARLRGLRDRVDRAGAVRDPVRDRPPLRGVGPGRVDLSAGREASAPEDRRSGREPDRPGVKP